MLHAQNQDRLYLIAPTDEQEALVPGGDAPLYCRAVGT